MVSFCRPDIDEQTISENLYTAGVPDPDLLIRTAGEMRISNFLLWQISYAEIWVTEKCWPEFDERTLHEAIRAYAGRNRRFGGLPGEQAQRMGFYPSTYAACRLSGSACRACAPVQRRSTAAARWPPNAIESFSACSSGRSRPTSGMQSRSQSGSGCVRFNVGGAKPSRNAKAIIASSTLPEAFTKWPSMGLVALTQTESAARPNAVRIPRLSSTSFCCVPVPWALM